MANISKSYIEARGEAINWLNSSKRDFNTGVNILAKSGYKPIIASKLAKQGEKSHTREKLEYEIRQMIKVWYNPNDPRFENVDIDDDAQHGDDGIPEAVPSADELNILTAAEDEAKKEGDEQHYPPVIAKIMYEFKDCYNTRSKLHKEMSSLGESNNDEVVAKRKVIVMSIKALSARMNSLAYFKKRFDSDGTLPTDDELDKLYADENEDNDKDDDSSEDNGDGNIESLSVEELKTLKANANTRLCRAKNMLKYSSVSKPKDGVENPLPDNSPKRIKYQKKVDAELKLIERIDYRIAELG